MPPILFRCPNQRATVQGWVADAPGKEDKVGPYACVQCIACGFAHWVNPRTGKRLGEEVADHGPNGCLDGLEVARPSWNAPRAIWRSATRLIGLAARRRERDAGAQGGVIFSARISLRLNRQGIQQVLFDENLAN